MGGTRVDGVSQLGRIYSHVLELRVLCRRGPAPVLMKVLACPDETSQCTPLKLSHAWYMFGHPVARDGGQLPNVKFHADPDQRTFPTCHDVPAANACTASVLSTEPYPSSYSCTAVPYAASERTELALRYPHSYGDTRLLNPYALHPL